MSAAEITGPEWKSADYRKFISVRIFLRNASACLVLDEEVARLPSGHALCIALIIALVAMETEVCSALGNVVAQGQLLFAWHGTSTVSKGGDL